MKLSLLEDDMPNLYRTCEKIFRPTNKTNRNSEKVLGKILIYESQQCFYTTTVFLYYKNNQLKHLIEKKDSAQNTQINNYITKNVQKISGKYY